MSRLTQLLAGTLSDIAPDDLARARDTLALSRLEHLRILLWVVLLATTLLLVLGTLAGTDAFPRLAALAPVPHVAQLRLLWVGVNLAALALMRRMAAPGVPTRAREWTASGALLANLLLVVALTWFLYPHFQSVDSYLLAVFTLAAFMRQDLRQSLLTIGLPFALAVAVVVVQDAGVVQTRSNLINLCFMTALAFAGMRSMHTATLRGLAQQFVIQRQNAELERLALTDGLTRLANRRALDQAVEREWRRAEREDRPLAAVILDIDHFKAFNDTCGHPAGDACLQLVALCLGRHLHRAGDLAARYGGEEFALLLPDTGLDGALAVAEDIRRGVADLAHPHPGAPLGHLTVSLGVACRRPGSDGLPGGLLEQADRALYRAKAGGRNRVAVNEEEAADALQSGPVAEPAA